EFAEAHRNVVMWPPETLAGQDLADGLAFLLASVLGIAPTELAEWRITRGCPDDEATVGLDLEAGILWRRLPRIAHDPAPEVSPRWSRPGSPWASFPLPPVVRRVLDAYRARIPGLQRGAPLFARATAFVSDSLEILPNNAKLLGRLARSEDRWLRQCGLPAVVAATISGRFDVTTLSTSAYCNLADAQIARAHADAGRRFFAMVRQEAIHRGWDVPAFADSGLLASAGTGRR